MSSDSLVGRLETVLQEIVALNDALMDVSSIDYDEHRFQRMAGEGLFIMGIAEGGWEAPTNQVRQIQRELLAEWETWWEHAQLLFSGDPPATMKLLTKAGGRVNRWIQRSEVDHSIPKTTEAAKKVFRQHVAPLGGILASHIPAEGKTIVVPDTNVLLRSPDIAKYGSVLDCECYTVFLVPGVLAELDAHKVNHRNAAVREKARKFGRRLKGWRAQGRLAKGVKVETGVFVQVEGREPDFDKTLSWLDATVVDDRIIASILEVQRRFPTTVVVLLTGDTVMLAKADLAHLPTADTPDAEVE